KALTPTSLSEEPILVTAKPKGRLGWRPITKFGPARRAYQQICVDILRASLPCYPFDFGDVAGGIDRMTDFILCGLQSGQYNHVVNADIKDCYGSITTENLKRMLCIPDWVHNKVLTVDRHTTLKMPLTWPLRVSLDTDEAVRRGLPQGASPSSLIVSRAVL